MNSLIPFQFESTQVRVVEIDGEPWFVAKDVAKTLGYSNPADAINRHCDDQKQAKNLGVAFHDQQNQALISGLHQETVLIPEADVYALVFGSKLESAKRFKRWVCEEVLPQIRKTGSYTSAAQRLPTEIAKQCVSDFLDVAALLDVPRHIGQQEAVKAARTQTGVDLSPLLVHAPAQTGIGQSDVMLEPTELAERLGVKNARQMNAILRDHGLQIRRNGEWIPTKQGKQLCTRHAWVNGNKSGYNLKWRLSTIREALRPKLVAAADKD